MSLLPAFILRVLWRANNLIINLKARLQGINSFNAKTGIKQVKINWIKIISLLPLGLLPFYSSFAAPTTDDYLNGYVQSIFEHNYGLPASAVTVRNGFVYIKEAETNGQNAEQVVEKLRQATSNIKGIKGIAFVKPNQHEQIDKARVNNDGENFIQSSNEPTNGAMPDHSLFHALMADPKWPRFTLAYQYHTKNRILKKAFAPNFGASIPLYRGIIEGDDNAKWEVGIQGGLFAIMDMGTKQNIVKKNDAFKSSLVNADYFISLPFSYANGEWSALARVYHVSTHLGDEFMLTPQGKQTRRINLSYEGIDAILSYHFQEGMRLYGGGGLIVHKDPAYIKRLKVQAGAEYRSPETFFAGRLRPVTGLDIKSEQMARWYPGLSYKAGVQFENSTLLISNEVQLMLEFYRGKSMHGQFYNDKIRYIGIGLHAFL